MKKKTFVGLETGGPDFYPVASILPKTVADYQMCCFPSQATEGT